MHFRSLQHAINVPQAGAAHTGGTWLRNGSQVEADARGALTCPIDRDKDTRCVFFLIRKGC
jgi:hypothetical protein